MASLNTTVPMAFAWGADDPVSGRHVLDALRDRIKGAPIIELEGVGHYPQLEAPEAIADFIAAQVERWSAQP